MKPELVQDVITLNDVLAQKLKGIRNKIDVSGNLLPDDKKMGIRVDEIRLWHEELSDILAKLEEGKK